MNYKEFENDAKTYLVRNYNWSIKQASFEFYRKYYYEGQEDLVEDFKYYVDIFHYKGVSNLVNIGDDCWDITDVMIALEHNIPKDIVHNRYNEKLDYDSETEGVFPNLFNYFLGKNKGKSL